MLYVTDRSVASDFIPLPRSPKRKGAKRLPSVCVAVHKNTEANGNRERTDGAAFHLRESCHTSCLLRMCCVCLQMDLWMTTRTYGTHMFSHVQRYTQHSASAEERSRGARNQLNLLPNIHPFNQSDRARNGPCRWKCWQYDEAHTGPECGRGFGECTVFFLFPVLDKYKIRSQPSGGGSC